MKSKIFWIMAWLSVVLIPLGWADISTLANRNLEQLLMSSGVLAVNIAKINGITPLMGNGVTGTGSQRVTIASDNTPFPIKIDQTTPGTTNLVDIQARPQDSSCKTVTVNAQGVANAGVTVDATAGGVTVLAASSTRCSALLSNLQGGGDALCAPTTVTVTTTVGFRLPAGQSLSLGLEAQQAWKCIRQGATSATLYVVEATS
jgi:hypothetical protein